MAYILFNHKAVEYFGHAFWPINTSWTLDLLLSLFVQIKLGKDGKKVKDKLKKLAAKVEEEDFSPDLEMVCWLV